MSALEGLVQRLSERGHKYDKRSLAQLISGLAQFMEDALGVNVSGGWAAAGGMAGPRGCLAIILGMGAYSAADHALTANLQVAVPP